MRDTTIEALKTSVPDTENSTHPRNRKLDNLKAVLILSVIFGHLIEPSIESSGSASYIYSVLYTFHIPAFVFLAGITSKRFMTFRRGLGLLLTLAIFQTIYVYLFADEEYFYLIQPYWILWYLLSLFFWRWMLPVFYRFPYPVFAALLIGLGSGCVAWLGYAFSLSRVFVFLPFFVAGHFYGPIIMQWTQKRPSLALTLLALVICLGCVGYAVHVLSPVQWLYGSVSYEGMNIDAVAGIWLRIVHYAAALSAIITLFIIMPDRHFRWTQYGDKVFSIYLLHGLMMPTLGNKVSMVSDFNELAGYMFALFTAGCIIYLTSNNTLHTMIQRVSQLK